MLKRLALGVLEGAAPGLLVALVAEQVGQGWGGAVAYLAAAAVGVATGLVAGKPFWAPGAKVESLLKAVSGAFLALVVMYGVRKWLGGVVLELSAIGAGAGALGDLPRVVLPVTGVAIAFVLEIDDRFGADAGASLPPARAEGRAPGAASEPTIEESGEAPGEHAPDGRAHREG
jgi:hypothetical protein